jgi:hypothetical protein
LTGTRQVLYKYQQVLHKLYTSIRQLLDMYYICIRQELDKQFLTFTFTEYGTVITTILPILFLYLNTAIVTAGALEP